MGFGGISPVQLLIIFGIVILIFGTAKLKNFGGDIGGAIKGFKKAMSDDDDKSAASKKQTPQIESGEKPDAEFSEQAEKEKQH
ncbi:MAG TPA: twin-arginine translocase TatA/TatE family subunit [Gammaproteobacteria bacterium]|nr:twin-arginine translocase TatA/TatE family subunit [Gammaproteobacteria bacterium]